ncbi:MAG: hypothetical protein ACHP65_07415, partial [Legionellales bacterium]
NCSVLCKAVIGIDWRMMRALNIRDIWQHLMTIPYKGVNLDAFALPKFIWHDQMSVDMIK